MSVSGEVYAEVEASVVNNGINPMAIVSGNPTPVDGQAYVVVWIRWRYDTATGDGGYTGQGWFWNDSNNALPKHWNSEEEFKTWLRTTRPTDLNTYLENWNATDKAAFLNKNMGVLEDGGCLFFAATTDN